MLGFLPCYQHECLVFCFLFINNTEFSSSLSRTMLIFLPSCYHQQSRVFLLCITKNVEFLSSFPPLLQISSQS
jgi:hypothetical protein